MLNRLDFDPSEFLQRQDTLRRRSTLEQALSPQPGFTLLLTPQVNCLQRLTSLIVPHIACMEETQNQNSQNAFFHV